MNVTYLVSALFPLFALGTLSSDVLAAHIFLPYQVVGGTLFENSWPESVAVGDVNNDGRQDVVLATSDNIDPENDYHIFVFLQNDAGCLATYPVKYPAGNGESIDIADVNSDNRKDVIVTAPNAIGVLVQNPSGSLDAMVTYPSGHESFTNTHKLKTGDFNNDGRTDVVSIDWGTQSPSVDIYLQNASGALTAPVIYNVSHGGYDDLDVGDVNNDGLSDIVVMSGQSYAYDNIGVLLQNNSRTFETPVYYDIGGQELTHGVAVDDVNNDHLQDIVVSYGGDSPSAHIGIFLQNDAGTLNPVTSYASIESPEPVIIADVNNDGRKDILTAHGGGNALGVFLQDDSGGLHPYELYPIPSASHYNPHGLAIGDINNDGKKDVVIADYNNGLVILYNQSAPDVDLEMLTNGKETSKAPGIKILVGRTIVWSYVITNNGDQDLTNITVRDDNSGGITCPSTSLAMGESMTCSASGKAEVGSHIIAATVEAKGLNDKVVVASDTGYYFGKLSLFQWPAIIPAITRGRK